MKLFIFGVFCVLVTFIAIATASFTHEDDLLATPIHFNACAAFYNTQHGDQTLCHHGSFIASLAMAMSTHKPYTYDVTSGNPTYLPIDLIDSLINAGIPSYNIYSNDVIPSLLTKLSPHLHFVHAFQLHALNIDSKSQFCSQLQAFPTIYLMRTMNLQTNTPIISWVSHCSRTVDTMTFTYQSPLSSGPTELSFDELLSFNPIVYEILVSYNSFEKYAYSERIAALSKLDTQTLFDSNAKTTFVFNLHQKNIYNEYNMNVNNQLGMGMDENVNITADDTWEIPYLWLTTFHQGDYQDIMQTKTIAQVGCLITSVAIGLRNHGIKFRGTIEVNPSTWNTFIRDHDGYVDGDNFIHTTIDYVCEGSKTCYTRWNDTDARHATNDVPPEYIQSLLKGKKRHVTAHVNNFHHFVAVIGWSRTTPGRFRVLDPAGRRDWFDYEEINGWRIYDITGPIDN